MAPQIKALALESIIAARRQGASLRTIAAMIGIAPSTIRRRLRSAGYSTSRDVKQAHRRPAHKGRRAGRIVLRVCGFHGCTNRAYADHVYCPTHQRRVDRHGDPSIALPRGRRKEAA